MTRKTKIFIADWVIPSIFLFIGIFLVFSGLTESLKTIGYGMLFGWALIVAQQVYKIWRE